MTNKTNKYYLELDNRHYLNAFKRFPVVFENANGAHVWDVEGNRYTDMLAGIAVSNIGHCHPKVIEAIRQQAGRLLHISNFYLNVPQAKLSEKLTTLSGLERVFFTSSGAESVEGAIKIARKYAHSIGRGGEVISFENCFHGRTLGTIAAGKKSMQDGFEPIPMGFRQVPFNDFNAVRSAVTKETAAIIIEPVQGEGGIHITEKPFMKNLRELCNKEKIVLIFDEVQCGMGRTGKMFAKEHFDVQPDIMTLAKALGGGLPLGAVLSGEKVSEAIQPGDHGTTFGGNPVVCAASLAAISVLEQEELLKQATEKGEWIMDRLDKLNEPSIRDIRGMGLMIGVEFDFETKPLVSEMFQNGVLANATANNVLRLVPPLNISYEDLEQVIEVIKKSLKTINDK